MSVRFEAAVNSANDGFRRVVFWGILVRSKIGLGGKRGTQWDRSLVVSLEGERVQAVVRRASAGECDMRNERKSQRAQVGAAAGRADNRQQTNDGCDGRAGRRIYFFVRRFFF